MKNFNLPTICFQIKTRQKTFSFKKVRANTADGTIYYKYSFLVFQSKKETKKRKKKAEHLIFRMVDQSLLVKTDM